jgi:enterochelin esterase family protein
MAGTLLRLAVIGGLGLAAAGAVSAADRPLAPNAPAHGTLHRRGDRLTVPVAAPEGAYVVGRLESGAVPFDLDLIGPDGRSARRLLTESTGRADFRFVVAEGAPRLRLTAAAGGGGAFDLSLSRVVAPEDQAPPAQVYLSPTMARLAETVAAGGGTEAFWAAVEARGTPLVEPHGEDRGEAAGAGDGSVVMTFVQRGARRNARLVGSPGGDHAWLDRLAGSDVWFKSFVVPATTRLSYRIAPDVPEFAGRDRERRVALLATAQADPYNRHPWPAAAPDPFNQESVVELPDAPVQPGLTGGSGAPPGALRMLTFRSDTLGNSRRIGLYTPAGFDPENPETVLLIVFDGDRYGGDRVPTPRILDTLIAQGRLPPVVAAFVHNAGPEARSRELPGDAAFAAVLAGDILPVVAAAAGLTPRPERTVLAGSSFGGLAAARIALAYPEVFGNALSMSGSFWWSPEGTPDGLAEHTAATVATLPRRPVRFFLSAGLFETSHGGAAGILDTTRHLRDVLVARGYAVTHCEYAAGHDYVAWRGVLGDGLLALFGRDQPLPQQCRDGLAAAGRAADPG